jgi:hypothetical protein
MCLQETPFYPFKELEVCLEQMQISSSLWVLYKISAPPSTYDVSGSGMEDIRILNNTFITLDSMKSIFVSLELSWIITLLV